MTRRRLISPAHREFPRKADPAVAGISRDFLKILGDRPSTRAAGFWDRSPRALLFRRLSDIPGAPPGNQRLAPRKRPKTESGDLCDFSIFPEDHMRLTVDPGRRILGAFGPLAPLFRRLLYIFDERPTNLALAPRMLPEGGSCDRRDFSRSPADRMRLAVDPGRLILGPFAPIDRRFRRLLYNSDASPPNLALAPGSWIRNTTRGRIF